MIGDPGGGNGLWDAIQNSCSQTVGCDSRHCVDWELSETLLHGGVHLQCTYASCPLFYAQPPARLLHLLRPTDLGGF